MTPPLPQVTTRERYLAGLPARDAEEEAQYAEYVARTEAHAAVVAP